jgi:hypothetical protein
VLGQLKLEEHQCMSAVAAATEARPNAVASSLTFHLRSTTA